MTKIGFFTKIDYYKNLWFSKRESRISLASPWWINSSLSCSNHGRFIIAIYFRLKTCVSFSSSFETKFLTLVTSREREIQKRREKFVTFSWTSNGLVSPTGQDWISVTITLKLDKGPHLPNCSYFLHPIPTVRTRTLRAGQERCDGFLDPKKILYISFLLRCYWVTHCFLISPRPYSIPLNGNVLNFTSFEISLTFLN